MSCLGLMVGERGFEPPTPWSRIQRSRWAGMIGSERNSHQFSHSRQFRRESSGCKRYPLTPSCTGMDRPVTSQVTSQSQDSPPLPPQNPVLTNAIEISPSLGFRPGGWPFLLRVPSTADWELKFSNDRRAATSEDGSTGSFAWITRHSSN